MTDRKKKPLHFGLCFAVGVSVGAGLFFLYGLLFPDGSSSDPEIEPDPGIFTQTPAGPRMSREEIRRLIDDQTVGDSGDFAAAFRELEAEIGSGSLISISLFSELIRRWISADPDSAVEFLRRSSPDLNPSVRELFFAQLVRMAPEEAFVLAREIPDGVGSATIEELARHDPGRAIRLMDSDNPALVLGALTGWARTDLTGAWQYAQTSAPPEIRSKFISRVLPKLVVSDLELARTIVSGDFPGLAARAPGFAAYRSIFKEDPQAVLDRYEELTPGLEREQLVGGMLAAVSEETVAPRFTQLIEWFNDNFPESASAPVVPILTRRLFSEKPTEALAFIPTMQAGEQRDRLTSSLLASAAQSIPEATASTVLEHYSFEEAEGYWSYLSIKHPEFLAEFAKTQRDHPKAAGLKTYLDRISASSLGAPDP